MKPVLRLVTPATERSVSINEARRHCRIEDTASDDLVATYIEAAEQSLATVGRALKPATYALDIYWPDHRVLVMPMPPFRAFTAIRVRASDGTLTTVTDTSTYTLLVTSEGRGKVILPPWSGIGTITGLPQVQTSIEYTAGYDTVPAALRTAIFLMVSSLFDNRSATALGNLYENPMLRKLAEPYQEHVV